MYSNAEQTVKSGSTIVAYCDYYNPAMATFKATKNGYVTISQNWLRGKQRKIQLPYVIPKETIFQMPLGKETVGLCYGEDKTSKVHWYKFKNPKAQKLNLTISGEASSGSLKVIVYDTKGKKTTSYHLAPGPAKSNTYTLKTRSKKKVLPKGTYYIKLVKNQKSTTGIYSLKVKAAK